MSKTDKNESLIPEFQDRESLLRVAQSFNSMADQLRFAAKQLEGRQVNVAATSTCRRSYGFVQNWVGNVFQAISSLPVDLGAEADAEAAEIEAQLPTKKSARRKKAQ